MKILVTTPYLYPETGGVERYVYHVFKRLAKKGHSVTIFSSTKQGYDSKEVDGMIINRLKPDLIISNTPIRLNLLNILNKELNKNSYDIIVSHTPVPYFSEITAIAANTNKIDYILTYHGPSISTNVVLNIIYKLLRISLEKYALNTAKAIITVNNRFIYRYLSKYIHKTIIIPPGVDTNIYIPKHYDPYNKKLLFIGQLTKPRIYKGLYVLLDAMPLILRYHPDTILTVVGDGPLKEDYLKECVRKGIEKNVIFVGSIKEEELINAYQSSTLLVVPSLTDTEGFGMVSLEANACGVPVVASKIGGIPYYVKDGINGFLVEPRNSKALAEKIIALLSNPDLLKELSTKSRERTLRFDWQKVANTTEHLLHNIYKNVQ